MYTEFYEKFKIQNASNGNILHPTLDCMGCARQVFCAYNFPHCEDNKRDVIQSNILLYL